MKKSFLVFTTFLLIVSFLGCNPKEDPTTQTTNQTNNTVTTESNNNNQFTIDDFYNQLISCKEHIDNILNNQLEEQSTSSSPNINKLAQTTITNNNIKTTSREEILNVHNSMHLEQIHDDYIEHLTNTEMFMSDIQDLLESQEDIPLFEPFHPEGDTSITYEFIISEEGYILINARYNTVHLYLKIGLTNDLLDYQEFHYFYSQDSLSPKDDLEMTFNYFKFLENEEAVYLNYLKNSSSLIYTNIQDSKQFEITKGNNIIEGASQEQPGYVLNVYNNETNVRTYLQIIEDEIISEAYNVYDEHGQVFTYKDEDFNDDMKTLSINIATATGWDYVVTNGYLNDGFNESIGVFLEDGTKIFNGSFYYHYNPMNSFVNLLFEFDETTEITNELFSLNQYGMSLDHPKANVEFLNQIKLENIELIKSLIQIDNLDFFTEDLQQEIYNYVDEDIRNDLEGNNEEPIETTGDVDEFLDAFIQFNNNLNINPNYQTRTAVTTSILDDNNTVLSESTSRSVIDFDLNAKYYRNYTYSGHNSFTYVLDGTKEKLIEFEYKGTYASYYIISDESTPSNFLEAYNEISGDNLTLDDMLNGVISITQTDERIFEFDVTTTFLSGGGVDMNILLEQQGITGLNNQTVKITYEFNEDYTRYEMIYTIENLTFDNYNVEISVDSSTEIETVIIISPQDLEYLKYVLPQTIEQTDFDLIGGPGDYAIPQGISYLRIYLEPGEYQIRLDGLSRDPEFTMMNEDLNTLEYDGKRFEATYEGYYYLKIVSTMRQNLTVYITNNPTPIYHNFDLSLENSNFEEYIDFAGSNYYHIAVPSATYDRLLIIYPYLFNDSDRNNLLFLDANIHEMNYYETCNFDWRNKTCYIYLPADQEIEFDLNGFYVGDFGFNYEYYEIPEGEFDNNHTWDNINESLMLWITEDSSIAHVDFTITEAGSYELNTYYKDLGHSYQDATLYQSDGTRVSFDWDRAITLEVGDYYIEFNASYSSELFVLIITEIIKN